MFDENWNQWRTSTVVGICRRIRQTGDDSALPILADALQDADCTDEEVLTELRSDLAKTRALRLVAQIEGGKPAEAVAWIDKFLEDFRDGYYVDEKGEWVDVWVDESRARAPGVRYVEEYRVTFDDLMEGAEEYAQTGDAFCLSFDTPDSAYDEETMKQFWKQYEAITGTSIERDPWFFRCAC